MKSKYVVPTIKVKEVDTLCMLSGSNLNGKVDDENQIEYGGGDTSGGMTPSSKRNNFIWDE